jgi:hypothetical protein
MGTKSLIVLLWAGLLCPSEALARSSLILGASALAPAKLDDKDQRVRKKRKKRKKRKLRKRRPRRRPRNFVQLKGGPGLRVFNPKRAWGTKLTIARLREVMADYHRRFPGASPVWIHDISSRRGGKLHPHRSHRNGRDVDIRLLLKRPTRRYVKATSGTLDLERTWFLVKQLVDTCDVEFIFLDARLQRALRRYAVRKGVPALQVRSIFRGFLMHWSGHEDHMHVRFKRRRHATLVAKCYCAAVEGSHSTPPGNSTDLVLAKADELQQCLQIPARRVARVSPRPRLSLIHGSGNLQPLVR